VTILSIILVNQIQKWFTRGSLGFFCILPKLPKLSVPIIEWAFFFLKWGDFLKYTCRFRTMQIFKSIVPPNIYWIFWFFCRTINIKYLDITFKNYDYRIDLIGQTKLVWNGTPVDINYIFNILYKWNNGNEKQNKMDDNDYVIQITGIRLNDIMHSYILCKTDQI
jgi:hypothetical protein